MGIPYPSNFAFIFIFFLVLSIFNIFYSIKINIFHKKSNIIISYELFY